MRCFKLRWTTVGGLPAWIAAGCLLLLAGRLPAKEPAPQPQVRVARLIKRLGSPSYSERKSAGVELERIGAEGRQQLEQAAAGDDPEVRLRAGQLLRRLKLAELWAPSMVSYTAKNEPASHAIHAVADQSGNRLLVGDQYRVFNDKPIDADYRDQPFWHVVDDVCRRTGNHVRSHYNLRQASLVLIAGDPGKYPLAYAGPLRAQVTSAERKFTEQFDYEDGSSEITHTFQLNVQVLWEDRFRLMAYRSQPELVEALTDTGVQLSAAQIGDRSWNVSGTGTRQLAASLPLHPPSVAAKRLARLALRWELIAVGDMATVEVSDLTAGSTHRRDDLRLVMENFEQPAQGKYVATLAVSRNLIVPEPHDVLYHENQVELLDSGGKPLRLDSQSGARTETGVQLKITFTGGSDTAKPATLRLHYPRLRSRRNVDIVFRDVPLPVRRPE